MTRSASLTRLVGGLTGVAGGILLARPRQVGQAAAGPVATPPVWIVRLLGGRYLLQSAAELGRPTKPVLVLSCVGDCLHAISMVAAMGMRPAYGRPASISAAAAAVSAISTAAIARTARR